MDEPAPTHRADSPADPRPGSGSTRPARISIRDLTKTFFLKDAALTAVDRVSIDIPEGCFFVVVGPSGCGKTTLLRILAELEEPTSGRVDVPPAPDGQPTASMIFQGDSVFPWMTVYGNAEYGLRMRGVPKAERRERVGHWLAKTGLSRFSDAYPHQLSGGMRQRVSIARAFANDPDVFLMDEPFSALDAQTRTLLQSELLRVWEESGKTVVFITHSVDEAVTLGDRVMIMSARPGRVKEILDVPLDRPRHVLELRKDADFGELNYAIWSSLRDEVMSSQELQTA